MLQQTHDIIETIEKEIQMHLRFELKMNQLMASGYL